MTSAGTFQEALTKGISEADEPISIRQGALVRRRFRNKAFQKMMALFAERAKENGMTKANLARKLSMDPAQVSRLFSGPTNVTLDSIAMILEAMNAEPDIDFVKFEDAVKWNHNHPLANLGGPVGGTPVVGPPKFDQGLVYLPYGSSVSNQDRKAERPTSQSYLSYTNEGVSA